MTATVRGALLVCLLVAGFAAVGTDSAYALTARLDGEFRMTGKITESNDGLEGQVKTRIYDFTPLCPAGECRKVSLKREGPGGKAFKSFLRRKPSGRYKGTENSGVLDCRGGGRGQQTVKLGLRIVRAEDGFATAIRMKAYFETDCPNGREYQRARVYGEIRQ